MRKTKIHHADQLVRARTGQRADHGQCNDAVCDLHAQCIADLQAELLQRCGRKKDSVIDQGEARVHTRRDRKQIRRQGGRAKRIKPDDRQQGRSRCAGVEDRRADAQPRAR